jgi:hypothetical protein
MTDADIRSENNFTGKEVRKLYHGDKLIGVVRNLELDWPNIIGKIELAPAAEEYKQTWAYFVEHGGIVDDPPFAMPENIFDDWFVEDEEGTRKPTELPAVHADGLVWFTV